MWATYKAKAVTTVAVQRKQVDACIEISFYVRGFQAVVAVFSPDISKTRRRRAALVTAGCRARFSEPMDKNGWNGLAKPASCGELIP